VARVVHLKDSDVVDNRLVEMDIEVVELTLEDLPTPGL
jgi:hypothetical protein